MNSQAEDQDEILSAIRTGSYSKVEPLDSPSGANYITAGGISFSWLFGLGDGKTVKIFDTVQPEPFAKQVRELLQ